MSHKCLLAILSLTGLLLASCAPAAPTFAPPPAPTATARLEQLQPQLLSSPSAVEPTQTEALTSTPEPFALDLTPLPSETALPTLQLPTEAARAPILQAWDGL